MKIISFFLFCPLVLAGMVRDIHTDDRKMNPVHLGMGQSTVLRFQERPGKIVIGNRNYYNIEFVKGSKDVTIQPLARVKTNLFIYTDGKTYGFILRTRNRGAYDDLVNIYWKERARIFKVRAKIVVPKDKKLKRIGKKIILKEGLSAVGFEVTSLHGRKTALVDFKIVNRSWRKQSLKGLEVIASRNKKLLNKQGFVSSQTVLEQGDVARLRLVVKLKKKRGFTVHVKLKDKAGKVIIPGRLL